MRGRRDDQSVSLYAGGTAGTAACEHDGMAGDSTTLAGAEESRRAAAVSSSPSPFGQNEWLVEEMYRKFREDPSSVDPSWHEFLVDYSPEPTTEAQSTTGNGQPAQVPAPAAA